MKENSPFSTRSWKFQALSGTLTEYNSTNYCICMCSYYLLLWFSVPFYIPFLLINYRSYTEPGRKKIANYVWNTESNWTSTRCSKSTYIFYVSTFMYMHLRTYAHKCVYACMYTYTYVHIVCDWCIANQSLYAWHLNQNSWTIK